MNDGPMNLTPEQAGVPASARNADPSGGVRRPNRHRQPENFRNAREAGRDLAEKLKEARASQDTPPTRRETPDEDLPRTRRSAPEPDETPSDETPHEEPSDETPESQSASDGDEGDEGEGTLIESLEDFAEANDLDLDDLKSLKAKVKVNGQELEVDLGKALANYQLDAAITQKSQRLSERERQVETEYQQTMGTLQQTYQQLQAQAQATVQGLQAELQKPEIARLEQEDPASYLWWQKHIGQRVQEIATRAQQIQQFGAQQMEQANQARIARERDRLRTAIPDWGPEKKALALSTLEKFGIAESEAQQMDHRAIVAATRLAELEAKVAEYEAREAKAKKGAKKIVDKQTGKGIRTGQRTTGKQISQKKIQSAVSQVKKARSGRASRNAAANAFATMIREGRKNRR